MKLLRTFIILLILFQYVSSICNASAPIGDSNGIVEDRQTAHPSITRDSLLLCCAQFDPVTLHRAMRVCRSWRDNIKGAHYLFLPREDAQQREEIFATRSFPELFRRAMNTNGGLFWLINWPGVYPSQFQSVLGTRLTDPKDYYVKRLKASIPPLLYQNVRYPTETVGMDKTLREKHTTRATRLIPYLKLVAVVDPERFNVLQEQITSSLVSLSLVITSRGGQVQSPTPFYLTSLSEQPNHMRFFFLMSPKDMDLSEMLPAYTFCMAKFRSNPDLTGEAMLQLCESASKIAHHSKTRGLAKRQYEACVRSALVAFEEATPELELKQRIAGLLAEYLNDDERLSVLADAGARQGVYTLPAVDNLYKRRHPKAVEGARQLAAHALESHLSGELCPFSKVWFKLLYRSPNPEDKKLAYDIAKVFYTLEGSVLGDNAYVISDIKNGIVFKILKAQDPAEAKRDIGEFIDDRRDEDDFGDSNINQMLWGAYQQYSVLNDTKGSISVLDECFEHPEALSLKNWLTLSLRYLHFNNRNKAIHCLGVVDSMTAKMKPKTLAKLAVVNARFGRLERARALFIAAIHQATTPMLSVLKAPNYSQDACEQALDNEAVSGVLQQACILRDMTFLGSLAQPFFELMHRKPSLDLSSMPYLCYFATRLGLKSEADLFRQKFFERKMQLATTTEREKAAAAYDIELSTFESLNENELFNQIISKVSNQIKKRLAKELVK